MEYTVVLSSESLFGEFSVMVDNVPAKKKGRDFFESWVWSKMKEDDILDLKLGDLPVGRSIKFGKSNYYLCIGGQEIEGVSSEYVSAALYGAAFILDSINR